MDTKITANQFDAARNVHDMSSINALRSAVNAGDDNVLQEAAQQFEAIFVQMMMKSMRKAQDVLADEDSPFNSEHMKFYRDMHDQQLSTDLSSKGGLGLAQLIVQQLGNAENSNYTPASVIRTDGNLPSLNRQLREQRQQAEQTALESTSVAVNAAYKGAAFNDASEFVQTLYPHAVKAANALGIDPKAIIAQAAVETGWGQYVIHDGQGNPSHNLFGIKANNQWQGNATTVDTLEFDGAVATPQKAAFRAYDSIGAAMDDYVNFIKSQHRYSEAVNASQDPQAYFTELQKAGYATDPQYANKVISVLQGERLQGLLP